jgi:hypothetical protein
LSYNIQGVEGDALIGGDLDWQAELFPYAFSDTFQMFIAYIPQRYDIYEVGVDLHSVLLLSF